MRMITASRFGGPEVLEATEVRDPVAGRGQVVVDVSVADTLYLDTVIRRGDGGAWSVQPPYVPGAGVAGEVASVGEGVDDGWVGRRVAAKSGTGGPRPETETIAQAAWRTEPTGGYAEQALARAAALLPVPDDLDLRSAAALVNDGLTAMLLMEAARPRPGEWALVTPGGGGLGSLLVQSAHAAGARVIAAARGDRKLDLAAELGADATVDYSHPGWPERVREATGGRGVDLALDGVGGPIGRASFELTAPGGRFLAVGVPGGGFTVISHDEAQRRQVTALSTLDMEWTVEDERRLPERALAEAAAGRIRPVIGQTFPLEKAADAHAAIEARQTVGKTLLEVGRSSRATNPRVDHR